MYTLYVQKRQQHPVVGTYNVKCFKKYQKPGIYNAVFYRLGMKHL